MTTLAKGGNVALASASLSLKVSLPNSTNIDISAIQLYADEKVRGDGDMCFYNQTSISGGALVMTGWGAFTLDTSRLPGDVQKVVLIATMDGNALRFSGVSSLQVAVANGPTLQIDTTGMEEAALILAEIYKRNGQWKVRHVAQGFNGGLKAISEHFGIEVAAPAPAPAPKVTPVPSLPRVPRAEPIITREPAPRPQPAPSINLSKVSLTKNDKTISLQKDDGRFGEIKVNLNWNQKPKKSGMLGLRSSAIDLDLGALIEDKHGNATAVQALGNCFGDFNYFPYVKLQGDDRTGAVTDGEWININGNYWHEIHRILIFAFIYEGVPNWSETDAKIRLMVPGQPEIEVAMNEFGSKDMMCAVALLENIGGKIKVSREVGFHKGHRLMDEHYGWGMNWRAGSK